MLNLMFGIEFLPLSAYKLRAIICYDFARDAETIYNALEELYCGFHAYILNGLGFHHLVKVSIPTKRNLNPPGAAGNDPNMSTPRMANGQLNGMVCNGSACIVVCF